MGNKLEEQTIVGSSKSGYVAGRFSATCFQDVPLYSLCQNTYHEQIYRNELGGKIRYSPIGLAFSKSYIYSKGGRPVIYEKLEVAKKLLQEDEWWRIVSFDLSNKQEIIDWTHEREWRLKGNFEFAIEKAYVLLTNGKSYKKFMNMASPEIIKSVGGIVVLDPILS